MSEYKITLPAAAAPAAHSGSGGASTSPPVFLWMKLLLPLPHTRSCHSWHQDILSLRLVKCARQCAAPCSSVLYMVMDTSSKSTNSMKTVGEFLRLRTAFYGLDFTVIVVLSLILLHPYRLLQNDSNFFKLVQTKMASKIYWSFESTHLFVILTQNILKDNKKSFKFLHSNTKIF